MHIQITYLFTLGKDESLQQGGRGHTHAIVVALLEGLEGRGHHVYVDNYYTSPALFTELRDLGFGACGTVRINRRGLPVEMKATLARGDVTSAYVDESMMALKWMDKRPVSMLTTIHDDSMTTKVRRTRRVQGGLEEIRKPVVVEQYNQFMGGVDCSDQLLWLRPQNCEVVEEGSVSLAAHGCCERLRATHTHEQETHP